MQLEPIETQRLAIRQSRPDDWKAVYEYMSDLEVIASVDHSFGWAGKKM